ncbi:MAG: hypothetical protein ACREX0_04285 [Noviherbaspirillum sp.]
MKALIVAAAIGLLAGCAGMNTSGSGGTGTAAAREGDLPHQEYIFRSYKN